MGFFETVGRRVEEFKQTAKKTAAETATYRCRACDARFDTMEDPCPECGATAVAPTETED